MNKKKEVTNSNSRMIPITKSEPFIFEDNQIRYYIKPKIGRIDMKWGAIFENFNTKGQYEKLDAVCDLVDLLVYKYESINTDEALPKFEAGHITDVLMSDSIIKLFYEIMRINGLTDDEKKSL